LHVFYTSKLDLVYDFPKKERKRESEEEGKKKEREEEKKVDNIH